VVSRPLSGAPAVVPVPVAGAVVTAVTLNVTSAACASAVVAEAQAAGTATSTTDQYGRFALWLPLLQRDDGSDDGDGGGGPPAQRPLLTVSIVRSLFSDASASASLGAMGERAYAYGGYDLSALEAAPLPLPPSPFASLALADLFLAPITNPSGERAC